MSEKNQGGGFFWHTVHYTTNQLPGLYWISGSGKSRIQPFFGNLAKSGSYQISSWICRVPVQLQYVQLITDKTNAADLSSDVFVILIIVTWTKKYKSLPFHKFRQKLANSDV